MCLLEKRRDVSQGIDRWAMRSIERCYCKQVVTPRRISLSCPMIPSYDEPMWYTDNPGPITLPVNWIPEKLDELLERELCCKLIYVSVITN